MRTDPAIRSFGDWRPAAKARLGAVFLCVCSTFGVGSSALAQSVPLLEPKPVFTPGMYETESRNSAFQDQPAKSNTCIASADYDAFRDETMAQYQKSPALKNCRLSDTRTMKNGFGFAMQCQGTKTVLTYEFRKDLVLGTIENLIEAAPKYSSSILIVMRRIGDCPGQEKGKPL
jgi:hypothetical protein